MLRNLLISILLILSQTLFAQELISNNSTILKEGIYRNFIEFKYNCPSISFKGEISPKRVGFYKSSIVQMERWFGYQNCYGFCDGADIYIRISPDNTKNPYFSCIELYGQFAFLPNYEKNFYGVPFALPFPEVLSTIDGRKHLFNKTTIEQIIVFDSLLYNSFLLEETLKEKTLKEYLETYSMKYSSSIPNLYEIESIVLNNTEKGLLCFGTNPLDTDYTSYLSRIKRFEISRLYHSIEIKEKYYKSGNLKCVSIRAKHSIQNSPTRRYKIGTHQYYFKNGGLKKRVEYNLRGQKNGRFQQFDEEGNITKDKHYNHGKLAG